MPFLIFDKFQNEHTMTVICNEQKKRSFSNKSLERMLCAPAIIQTPLQFDYLQNEFNNIRGKLER
jgi:hypothetical protein